MNAKTPWFSASAAALRVAARGDHHDGHVRVEPAKLLERLQPVHHRHVQVDEHEIGTTRSIIMTPSAPFEAVSILYVVP